MDSDGDGISDVSEKYFTHTDPNNPDTDLDGTADGIEVWQDHTDPRTVDEGTDHAWRAGHDDYVDGVGEDLGVYVEG